MPLLGNYTGHLSPLLALFSIQHAASNQKAIKKQSLEDFMSQFVLGLDIGYSNLKMAMGHKGALLQS